MSFSLHVTSRIVRLNSYLNTIKGLTISTNCNVGDVLAIIDMESDFKPFFDENDTMLFRNLETAKKLTGLNEEKILNQMTYLGNIAKFRISEASWKWAQNQSSISEERLILSCSYGLGQKLARYLNKNCVPIMIKDFAHSPTAQIRVIVSDLEELLKKHILSRPLAFSEYNAGKVNEVTEYGRKAADLAKEYKKLYGK